MAQNAAPLKTKDSQVSGWSCIMSPQRMIWMHVVMVILLRRGLWRQRGGFGVSNRCWFMMGECRGLYLYDPPPETNTSRRTGKQVTKIYTFFFKLNIRDALSAWGSGVFTVDSLKEQVTRDLLLCWDLTSGQQKLQTTWMRFKHNRSGIDW